jgi:transposase InsO family protein
LPVQLSIRICRGWIPYGFRCHASRFIVTSSLDEHESVQGSQYTALIFGQTCRNAGIEVSMGCKGCAYDNAVKESFFATLKKDLVHRRSWPTRQELRTAVFDYIECFYNPVRLHSTLGYLSPVEYEQRHTAALILPASVTQEELPLAA